MSSNDLHPALLAFDQEFKRDPLTAVSTLKSALENGVLDGLPELAVIRTFVEGLIRALGVDSRTNGVRTLSSLAAEHPTPVVCLWLSRSMLRASQVLSSLGASLDAVHLYFGYMPHIKSCPTCQGYQLSYSEAGILMVGNAGMYEPAETLAGFVIDALPPGHDLRLSALSSLRSALSLGRRTHDARRVNTQLLSELAEANRQIPSHEMLNQASFAIDSGEPQEALGWLARLQESGLSHEVNEADFFFTKAQTLGALGFLADAVELYQSAAAKYLAYGAVGFAAECYQNIGALLNASRFHEQALPAHRKATRLFREFRRPQKVAACLINYAEALRAIGSLSDAQRAVGEAIEMFDGLQDPYRATNARLLLVQILLAENDHDLERAEKLVDEMGNRVLQMNDSDTSIRYWHIYAEVLIRHANYAGAIEAIGKARAFAAQSMERLSEAMARAYAMATRFADLDRCLAHALILSGKVEEGFQVYEQSRTVASIVELPATPKIVDVQQTLGRLPESAGAIVFQALGPTTYVWAMDGAGFSGGPIPGVRDLRREVRAFYESLETGHLPSREMERRFGDILGEVLTVAHPCIDAWSRVFLVPDRVLAYLPWTAAIRGSKRPFLDGSPVLGGIYPNISLLYSGLCEASRRIQKRAVIVGNPMNTRPPLPGAEAEARAIGVFLTESGWQVEEFIGPNAQKRDVVQALGEFAPSLLIIASHAKANHFDPRKSGLWLGGESTQSGTMTVDEILQHPEYLASVEAVWLNVCEGATPSMMLLDSQVSLATSLLHSGARCVLANLWSVSDTAALALGLLFFGNAVHGNSVAEAVRRAQRALAEKEVSSLEQLPQFADARGLGVGPMDAALRVATENLQRKRDDSRVFGSLYGWGALAIIGNGFVQLPR